MKKLREKTQLSEKKLKNARQTSQRRFDAVETSPNVVETAILAQNWTQITKAVLIGPQSNQKRIYFANKTIHLSKFSPYQYFSVTSKHWGQIPRVYCLLPFNQWEVLSKFQKGTVRDHPSRMSKNSSQKQPPPLRSRMILKTAKCQVIAISLGKIGANYMSRQQLDPQIRLKTSFFKKHKNRTKNALPSTALHEVLRAMAILN